MQLLQWLSVFAFGLLVSAEQQSAPKELDIKTTYTPSDCTVKAQKGDPIKVHYVRSYIHMFFLSLQSLPASAVLMCVTEKKTKKLKPFSLSLSRTQTGTLFSNGNKFDSRYDSCLFAFPPPPLLKTE
jgi:hypothetical protein